MVYEKIKDKLVREQKILTSKQLRKLAIRLGIITVIVTLMVALLSISTVGAGVTLFVMIGGVFAYAGFFDMFAEIPDSALKFLKWSKLWPLLILLFAGEYFALVFFNFM